LVGDWRSQRRGSATAVGARVAVVIATRNRRDTLLDTLPRLLDLPSRPPVVVVDNGSDDGTVDAVRERHPEARVIPLGEDRGGACVAAGGFHRRYGIGGEEELLALDLAVAGWGLVYVDDVVAHHHPAPSRDPAARRRIVLRNALWSAWLRQPLPGAVRDSARLLRAALTDEAARRGAIDAVRGLPWVVRERRPVPADVARAVRTLW